MNTPIARLRIVGLLEGSSFLLLLGIAMPLKYMFDMPMAVRYVGWGHGLLFMLYGLALFQAAVEHEWPLKEVAFLACAAVIPGGPFFVDGRLKQEDQDTQKTTRGRDNPTAGGDASEASRGSNS